MTSTLQPIIDFEDALRLLGGPTKVGRLTGRSAAAVCQWRTRDARFPSEVYRIIGRELAARGYSVPLTLFRFDEPDQEVAR